MAFSGQNLVSDVSLREITTLSVPQNGTKSFELIVRDKTTGQPMAIDPSARVNLTSMYRWMGDEVVFNVEGMIVDAAAGRVSVTLLASHTDIAGVFTASLSIFVDNLLLHAQPFYIAIEPVDLYASNGAPTIAELRLYLRDTSPENSFLLDETEFSDSEIAACLRLPIDKFNEMSPPIGVYTVDTFPFRYHWIQCTIGHLLRIAAHHYRRERLQYSAGGIGIDPEANKAEQYEQIATMRIKEFADWAQEKKISLNIDGGYGFSWSPYSSIYNPVR